MQEEGGLGQDSLGNTIEPVSLEWVSEVERLYEAIDEEKRGAIEGDRVQFFLMALLLTEIKDHNKQDMILLVQKQTASIMDHMFHCRGFITMRSFKQYLMIQRLRREAEIQTLHKNMLKISQAWATARRSKLFNKFPII